MAQRLWSRRLAAQAALAPQLLPTQADLFLRKGALHPNQPRRIKSLALANRSLTASGAAGTGRGQSVAGAGHVCVLVTFENGVTQLMAK